MAQKPKAGLLTCSSSLRRLAFPFRRTVARCAGRSLLTVAGPWGFSPASLFTRLHAKASTSGESQHYHKNFAFSIPDANQIPERLIFFLNREFLQSPCNIRPLACWFPLNGRREI